MAISGTRKPKKSTNEGKGFLAVVNSLRKRNSLPLARTLPEDTAAYTVPMAVSAMSTSRMCMRTLVRWSAISLVTTAHRPVQGEPSRSRGTGVLGRRLRT